MAAEYRGSADGSDQILRAEGLGDNSAVMGIGDYVAEGTAGEVILATAGDRLLGVINGFVSDAGGTVSFDDNSLTDVTMASDNQTSAKRRARIDVNSVSIYSIPLDASAGTTTGSDKPYVYFDLVDHESVDESSVVTDGTGKQLYSLGIDPNNASNVLVVMAESSLHR